MWKVCDGILDLLKILERCGYDIKMPDDKGCFILMIRICSKRGAT